MPAAARPCVNERAAADPPGRIFSENVGMPWRPHAQVEHNPELDAFRRVAATQWDGNRFVGHLVCKVEPVYTLVGGHLWWRRWTGREVVYGYEFDGDQYHDWVCDPAHPTSAVFLDDLRADWLRVRNYDEIDASGEAPIVDEYRVQWLDGAERAALLQKCCF